MSLRVASIIFWTLTTAGCDHQDQSKMVATAASGGGSEMSYAVASGVFSPIPEPKAVVSNTTGLVAAKRGFVSRVVPGPRGQIPPPPPANIFQLTGYQTPNGVMAAYQTPDPGDGQKHPAIVWITGGDCNTIGEVWDHAPRDNDQNATAYRQAGIIMMFPSLRGGNSNAGLHEGFLGEVDDVIAAGRHLSREDYVDPRRIYLGGHSTGGTLVMLVAESTDFFRATFSFGPVDEVRGYSPEFLPFDRSNSKEFEVRSPGRWLADVRKPLFVFEGSSQGNISSLNAMARSNSNPLIQFFPVPGHTHFSLLAPVNDLIARKILDDTGPACQITFTAPEIQSVGQ
jgi:hypothetical protein